MWYIVMLEYGKVIEIIAYCLKFKREKKNDMMLVNKPWLFLKLFSYNFVNFCVITSHSKQESFLSLFNYYL